MNKLFVSLAVFAAVVSAVYSQAGFCAPPCNPCTPAIGTLAFVPFPLSETDFKLSLSLFIMFSCLVHSTLSLLWISVHLFIHIQLSANIFCSSSVCITYTCTGVPHRQQDSYWGSARVSCNCRDHCWLWQLLCYLHWLPVASLLGRWCRFLQELNPPSASASNSYLYVAAFYFFSTICLCCLSVSYDLPHLILDQAKGTYTVVASYCAVPHYCCESCSSISKTLEIKY